jgi:hypothetical protein
MTDDELGIWPIHLADWTAEGVARRDPRVSAAANALQYPSWLRATDDADCPLCGAVVGERCKTKGGNPTAPHSVRDERRRMLATGHKPRSSAEEDAAADLAERRSAHREAQQPGVVAEARSLSAWPEGPPESRPGVWVVGRGRLVMALYVQDDPCDLPSYGMDGQAVRCSVRMLACGRWAWAVVSMWPREWSDLDFGLRQPYLAPPHAGIEFDYIDAGRATRLTAAQRTARRIADRYIRDTLDAEQDAADGIGA